MGEIKMKGQQGCWSIVSIVRKKINSYKSYVSNIYTHTKYHKLMCSLAHEDVSLLTSKKLCTSLICYSHLPITLT